MSILLTDCNFEDDLHLLRFLKFLSYKKDFYFYKGKVLCEYKNMELFENSFLLDYERMTLQEYVSKFVGYTLVQFNIDIYRPGLFETDLYSLCRESIFKNVEFDNYLNFSSYDEIYKIFPEIKLERENFKEFSETHKGIVLDTDLIRLLLTKHIKNMLYIDSDIKINEKLTKDKYINEFIIFKEGLDLFFSKKFGKMQALCLSFLNKDYYSDSDFYVKILSKCLKVYNCEYTEYWGLMTPYKKMFFIYKNISNEEIDDFVESYIKNNSLENIIFIFPMNLCIYKHYKNIINEKIFYGSYEDPIIYAREINIMYEPFIEVIM